MELEEERENFSRAMTNIITTDLDVLEPEEVRVLKFILYFNIYVDGTIRISNQMGNKG